MRAPSVKYSALTPELVDPYLRFSTAVFGPRSYRRRDYREQSCSSCRLTLSGEQVTKNEMDRFDLL